ncbi:MAG: thrombospondin type 3 repeat-containing protein [Gammaproteobacteria bacterium]
MFSRFTLPTILITGAVVTTSLFFLSANDAPVEAAATYTGPKLAPGGYMTQRRLYGSEMSQRRVAAASRQAQAASERARSRSAQGDPAWQFVGPVNIGGRVLDIAVDPILDDTLFVASASGGVWRSSDAGDTFQSVWPNSNAQAIGALAMSTNGTLYAGTGESGPGGGSPTYGNDGVFKSTDRGASWTNIGLNDSERISRLIIDPNNEQRLFVAATGPLYAPGGERGVYRSADGGENWTLVLAGDNATTGASDVHIDPADSNRLYAVMWDHLREPSLRRYGGEGSGIYRSVDGGDTWARLTTDLPPVGPDVGRIALGVSPNNANRLYAIYLNTIGQFLGMFESANGGDNWTLLPFDPEVANSQSVFGWWFSRIWVEPNNDSVVYVAGVPLVRTLDGGVTWTSDFSLHVDHHALAWDPKVAGRVYSGNDGGVYRSDTNGTPDSWVFASVQPFTQFYTMDVDQQLPERLVGGTQDNRCLRNFASGAPSDWNVWACGDGLENLINPTDSNLLYGCSQYGNCVRSFDGGDSTQPIGDVVSARRNWLTPLLFDPNDPSVMYYAGDTVNRSTDGGSTWTAISPDLTGGDPFPTPIDIYPFGTVSTLAVAKTDPNRLYAGTDDARLWVTSDQGVTWTQITAPGLPERWVTKIVIDEFDADTAYVAYSGFRNDDNTAYVFRTTDGGVSFIDITSDLPPAPVNTLALRPDGSLYAGTDVGVYLTEDSGASWRSFSGFSMPQVPINDLRIHEPTRQLYAATFGRGLYQIGVRNLDVDSDGVLDFQDNCSELSNADQIDADGDGYGNACDADFNNDCVVNVIDLGQMRAAFFTADASIDLNNDGVVNVIDLGVLRLLFFSAPGPSGFTDVCS